MKFAISAGYLSLEVEGDAQILINSLISVQDSSPIGHLTEEILLLSSFCCSCEFKFVKREGNKVAHVLARHALNLPSLSVWFSAFPS